MVKKLVTIRVMTILILVGSVASADTLEVKPSAAPGGTTPLGDIYTCIQDAIDDANDYDTLNIHEGTYTEQLTITDKALTITDAGDGEVIIEADTLQTGLGNTFTISAAGKDITLSNLTIRHGDYGIKSSAGNVNVLNCIFYHNGYDGTALPAPITQGEMDTLWDTHCTDGGAMRIENSAASEIANCTVYDNDRGIRFQDGANGNIHHNTVHNNFQAGIYLASTNYDGTTGCSDTQVHHNDSYQNYEHGVLCIGGINNTISDNELYDNWNCGVMLWHPGEVVVQGNTINNNNLYGFNGAGTSGDDEGGIWAAGATGAAGSTFDFKILGNTISNNNLGGEPQANGIKISSLPGNGIEITGNTLTNHDIDILLLNQAANTVINNNSFDGSGIGVQNDDTSANVDATLNWWGDPSGPQHATKNPAGAGDEVSDYVDFIPWYIDAAMTKTPSVYNISKDLWYATIQSAIDDADLSGNTIEIGNETYTEQLAITDKGLTLAGESETGVIVEADPNGPVAGKNTFTINASGQNITIQTMTIRHGDYGIRSSAGNVSVLHCTIYHNGWDGTPYDDPPTQSNAAAMWASDHTTDGGAIRIKSSTGCEVAYCTVYENLRGIRFSNSLSPHIHHCNSCNNVESGIYLSSVHSANPGVDDAIVEDCNSINNMNNGLLNIGGSGNIWRRNNVQGNWNSGVCVTYADQIIIEDNTIEHNNLYSFNGIGSDPGDAYGGIYVYGDNSGAVSFALKVLDNTISDNEPGQLSDKTGVYLSGSIPDDGIEITGNTFTNHDIDVLVRGQAANVVVNNNSFGTNLGINNEDTSATVNGTFNWWGSADGPGPVGPGSGTGVSDYVDYSPWYTNASMTTFAWDEPVFNITKNKGYDTIQAAIDDADPCDTIEVSAGTYPEYVHITTDGLTIQGAGIDQSIIDLDGLIPYWHYAGCSSSFASRAGVLITGWDSPDDIIEDVTFTGFTVKNAGLNPPVTATGQADVADPTGTVLTHSTASFPTDGSLVGQWVHNVSDKLIVIDISGNNPIRSYGQITANTATTITATLSGGQENDWDIGDTYVVMPYEEYVDVAEDLQDDITGISIQNGKDIAISYCKSINNGSSGIGGSYARCVSAHKYSEGITIDHCTSSDNPRNGISIGKYVGAVTITNNTCSNNGSPHPTDPSRERTGVGIQVSGLNSGSPISGVISDNICADSGFEGILLKDYSDGVTVEKNTVTGSNLDQDGAGIFFYGKSSTPANCDNHIIRNNIVTGNIRGIVAYYAQACTIEGNTITTDAGTFPLGQAAIKIDGSNNMIVKENDISCDGMGIHVQNTWNNIESHDNTFTDNTITGAQFAGIAIWGGAYDNTFLRNTITGTTELTFWAGKSYEETQADGVFIDDDAGTGNVFNYNNIHDNDHDGLENQVAATTVDAQYNYWGHCTGPYHDPNNLDGQGDAVSGNVDYDPWLIYPMLTSDKADCSAIVDLNGDGCINMEDFAMMAEHWMEGCI